MISVLIGTNLERKTVLMNPDKIIKDALEENNIDYSRGGVHLDGESLTAADLNKTFADKGITSDCILVAVVKSDGGC